MGKSKNRYLKSLPRDPEGPEEVVVIHAHLSLRPEKVPKHIPSEDEGQFNYYMERSRVLRNS